jgi:hypothetical protein
MWVLSPFPPWWMAVEQPSGRNLDLALKLVYCLCKCFRSLRRIENMMQTLFTLYEGICPMRALFFYNGI